MPPKGRPKKRPATSTNDERRKKRKRAEDNEQPARESRSHSQARSSHSRQASSQHVKNDIRWILPTKKVRRKTDFDRHAAETFAPALFGEPWAELQNLEEQRLEQAPIRSPVFRSTQKIPQRQIDQEHDKYRSSAALRRLFAQIQTDTSDEWSLRTFNFHNFASAFGDVDADDHAVVASEGQPPLTVDGDLHAAIPLPQDHQRIVYRTIRIIRRFSCRDASIGYFIQLPSGEGLTVNGERCQNDDLERPIIIGPLESFAVIEFFGQPIFFWRRRSDVFSASPRRIEVSESDVEQRKRDTLAADVKLVWVEPEESSEDEPEDSDEDEETGFEAQADPGSRADEDEDVDEDQQTFGGLTPCEYLRRRLDDFVDEIQHQREVSGSIGMGHIPTLINIVLLAINARQPESAGFAQYVGDRTLRPARPWLFPIFADANTTLVVAQIELDQRISLHVMDPLEWESKVEDRQGIFKQALNELLSGGWLYQIGSLVNDILTVLPREGLWVDSAQVVEAGASQIYTLLNAWVLALGLAPDPNFGFAESDDKRSYFFEDAESLFYLVLSKQHVDWKLLLAFFRCYDFIIDDAVLPPGDRRFTLARTPFQTLVQQERSKDMLWRQRNRPLDVADVVENVGIKFNSGRPHHENFRSDVQTDEFKEKYVQKLIGANLWNRTLTDEQLMRTHDTTYPPIPSPGSSASSRRSSSRRSSSRRSSGLSTASLSLSKDESDIPEDFEACSYFRTTLEVLKQNADFQMDHKPGILPSKEIFGSVAAVVQAITHIQTPDRGFGIIDYETFKSFELQNEDHPKETIFHLAPLLLLPWTIDDHTTLLVAQKEPEGSISIHVFDSASWFINLRQRMQLRETIVRLFQFIGWIPHEVASASDTSVTMSWVTTFAEASDTSRTGYYTILTAWALALGQTLNPYFRPPGLFFEEASQLIQLVLKGLADWKLIWAFLRCTKFIRQTEVDPGDRFTRTVTSAKLNRHLMKLKKRSEKLKAASPSDCTFFDFPDGLAHSDAFPSDDWEDEHRERIAPLLVDAEVQVSELDAAALSEAYSVLQKRPSLSTSDNDLSQPCTYFRESLKRAASDPYVKKNMRKVELSPGGVWMLSDEVSQAIAAITLAISTIQDVRSGYSFVHPDDLEICESDNDILAVDDAIRPGRPTIVPFTYENHTVLIIIQLSGNGDPEISVLDSRPYHHKLAGRTTVYGTAINILQRSSWWRRVFNTAADVPIPDHATWISGAVQTEDWSCGYHAIFQAWALALGLELNLNFEGDWDIEGRFFQDVQIIVRLARIGAADWKMILAFLRCYDIVVSDHNVESLKKFSNTMRIMDRDSLRQILRDLQDGEERFWASGEPVDVRSIRDENRILLPEGKPHNTHRGSDGWSPITDATYIPKLIRLGRLNLDLSEEQVLQEYFSFFPDTSEKAIRRRVEEFLHQLRRKIAKIETIAWEPMAEALHRYLGLSNPSNHNLHKERIDKMPCAWTNEYKKTYKLLRNWLQPKRIAQLPRYGTMIDDWQVVLAIAAVVEAIDSKQAQEYTASAVAVSEATGEPMFPFSGGFTIATAFNIACGMSGESFQDDFLFIGSRPRRCWLMPVVVASDFLAEVNDHIAEKTGMKKKPPEEGHIILCVIQEEESDSGKGAIFRVYFIDSLPKYLWRAYDLLFDRVKKAAEDLLWASHRNSDNHVLFQEGPWLAVVPEQENDWSCGYHTILNAWILALGLTPNPNKIFDDTLYHSLYEMVDLALSGILDWKTLTAWLFCHELTIERSVDLVQRNRRFARTRQQHTDGELGNRVEMIYNDDDGILGSYEPEAVHPYDRSNNVDFWTAYWTILDPEDDSEGLQRAFEDAEEWEDSDDTEYVLRSERQWRANQYRWTSDDDSGLGFLNDLPDPGARVSLLY